MSEEKLYAIKSNDGEWADSHYTFGSGAWATPYKAKREEDAKHHGGHVVALVEEPEKVVLTKEQAEIVEKARVSDRVSDIPATYISARTNEHNGEESLLMNAYVNGYTVEKETKYNVKVPHVPLYYWKKPNGGLGVDDLNVVTSDDDTDDFEFTEAEIEHYGLQDCEKEEVTDNGE